MADSLTPEQHTYRVSLGMRQRLVRADGAFDAAHKCGLGSGDLLSAEIELLDDNGKVIAAGGFSSG